MRIRDKSRVQRTRQMLRAAVNHPCMVVKLPIVGLADVWVYDGWAWVFPGSGGLLRFDWFQFMRSMRRIWRRK